MPQFVVPPEGISYRDAEASFQRGLIESALEAAGGVQKRAAELLHIKPTTLNEMIKRHDIRPRRKKAPTGPRAPRTPTASTKPSRERRGARLDRGIRGCGRDARRAVGLRGTALGERNAMRQGRGLRTAVDGADRFS